MTKRINLGLTEPEPAPCPFVALLTGEFADMITHCKVCRLPRRDDWPLQGNGYCESCYTHIPERFRQPPNRGHEERRMFWLLRRTAQRFERPVPYLTLIWCFDRNTWLWRKRGTIDGTGRRSDFYTPEPNWLDVS